MAASIETKIQQQAFRNGELLRILSETDYATPAHVEHKRYIKELEDQVARSSQQLKALDGKRQASLKDHERYRDSHAKRFFYKAAGKKEKFAQKAEKEEREYFDVLQDLQQQTTLSENLKVQVSEAHQAEEELSRQAKRHGEAQQELQTLYDSIFSGPTPQFPEEDALERDAEQKVRLYQETRTQYEAESLAIRHLEQGMKAMNGSIAEMDSALSYSRMDMFGGGTLTDMMERNHLSRAQQQLMQAQNLVLRASQASPHVYDLPRVNINQGSIMSDVLFDNIFTDMAFHEEIKRGMAEVMRATAALDTQLSNARQRHRELQGGLTQRESDMQGSRAALQKTREEVFHRVLAGSDGLPSYDESSRHGVEAPQTVEVDAKT